VYPLSKLVAPPFSTCDVVVFTPLPFPIVLYRSALSHHTHFCCGCRTRATLCATAPPAASSSGSPSLVSRMSTP
jgi:hypothetical protein